MSEVQRWHVGGGLVGGGTWEEPRGDGEWCKYEDYEHLAAEVERLRELAVEAANSWCPQCGDALGKEGEKLKEDNDQP